MTDCSLCAFWRPVPQTGTASVGVERLVGLGIRGPSGRRRPSRPRCAAGRSVRRPARSRRRPRRAPTSCCRSARLDRRPPRRCPVQPLRRRPHPGELRQRNPQIQRRHPLNVGNSHVHQPTVTATPDKTTPPGTAGQPTDRQGAPCLRSGTCAGLRPALPLLRGPAYHAPFSRRKRPERLPRRCAHFRARSSALHLSP